MTDKQDLEITEETDLIMTVRGIFQIFLIVTGVLLWIFSIYSEGIYLGKYLQHLLLPHWLQFWLIPAATVLIPILGIFAPVLLFFHKEGRFAKHHMLGRVPIRILIDILVFASMILLVISPIFLAVFITVKFSEYAQLIILATSLVITFILILRSIGILHWIKHFIVRMLRGIG